jgi:hypothetical protein
MADGTQNAATEQELQIKHPDSCFLEHNKTVVEIR